MKDLQELSTTVGTVYDICIIGSGPAGIILCAELADTNIKICLLESGGLRKSKKADELRRVISDGVDIKAYSRERVVGGASSTWSGLSATLDEIDMAERDFLGVPGWPIAHSGLERYWEAASAKYRFPSDDKFKDFALLRTESEVRPQWTTLAEKVFLAPSEPQRFAKEHESIFKRENVDLVYNATVVRLEGRQKEGRNIVEHAVALSPDKHSHTISARFFVLATGGIENARLLLNSTDLCSSGLGNEHDRVGRYFMNHPKNTYGVIRLKKPVHNAAYYFGCMKKDYLGYAGLRLRHDVQQRLKVLNSYVRLEPIFPWSGNPGVQAAVFLAKKMKMLLSVWKKNQSGQTVPLRDYAETGDDSLLQAAQNDFYVWLRALLSVFFNLPTVVRYAHARLWWKNKPPITKLGIRNFMEMEPHPENRVILGEHKDEYGQPVPIVRHAPTTLDRLSLVKLHNILAEEFETNGLGDMESNIESETQWPVDQDASHHLGATRMGNDPATSVVNSDLRLHGVENVFCAGGSVFSTSGCANPTLTICALSIRLAEHLKKL